MPTTASTWSDLLPLAATLALVFLLSLAGTGALARLLHRRGILDRPNERSSHSDPTPRGGGLAIVGALLLGWPLLLLWQGGAPPAGLWIIWSGALLLAAISFVDDLVSLGAAPRFAAQIVAVAAGLALLDGPGGGVGPVFQGLLPFWLDRLLAGLAWLWFVNLYNFMDGIDGITGVESAGLGIGIALLFGLGGALLPAGLALLIAAAAVGFLAWNWQPARIFMGDVGSVPLGFLLGWLLLLAAAEGQWAAALILPAYYWCDATITLLRRAARRERVWRAHREHFYQRAVQRGLSHAAVARLIGFVDAGLIVLALLAGRLGPWTALAAAALLVAWLLRRLARGRARQAGAGQHA
ncbi:UDP-N-acetylmuramyl pentapeptide phosphotransferase/UDP-N-acetylglucosamine-1-phosphate transferase [Tistlia consotensis]|uniref:UDP-N-acetylmuramyl pentapeptide phosphotransferase/UDP-N-acetylglucosamine-1-phosphate transferase n=1 Tax=Tistlia consotensis USBA 355 TaxID=560819 RepID=A0A1Y6BHR9_9PROT|nr:glycosyltransferase family 4 protein [Tistlia consotensis]SMF09857.1 UDP-N-acetylmuramyl pentapeptide phosphotransferase/UDP-N-acetylglucosamine-1-phosphate transferase [Tistlia consotensis USBA 355]SNR34211.1 UDP-N-acetylmuramyl pentapeptide phosphotransferase/UDP-N-acetylglucosamine-1-phosphate transferase [Tistlia consotensis]